MLQGQNPLLAYQLHALAGLVPEPVRQYCTNIRCIIEAGGPTVNPLTLLRGLYPTAPPEELAGVGPDLMSRHLSAEAVKTRLVEHVVHQVFAGQELRHGRWCQVRHPITPHQLKFVWVKEQEVFPTGLVPFSRGKIHMKRTVPRFSQQIVYRA